MIAQQKQQQQQCTEHAIIMFNKGQYETILNRVSETYQCLLMVQVSIISHSLKALIPPLALTAQETQRNKGASVSGYCKRGVPQRADTLPLINRVKSEADCVPHFPIHIQHMLATQQHKTVNCEPRHRP